MRRRPYIRFFISSTFADMERERNLLKSVFDSLREDYGRRGWQIDYVDLRWGISDEASADNRTMRICLEELHRSREMSPRPNFILLLGERYGWMPLPETLSAEEYNGLYGEATLDEMGYLERWYDFDSNALPDGRYELRRRDTYSRDCHEFDYAERGLRSLLDRYGRRHAGSRFVFDRSATEQEIREGLLGDAEAQREHVIGYVRTLSGVPADVAASFTEKDADLRGRLGRLRDEITATVEPDLLYRESNISYGDYQNESFAKRFTEAMTARLRRVIDAEIARNSAGGIDDELDVHRTFAAEESARFFGREIELQRLRNYIDTDGPQTPLRIVAPSGTGKSALSARIVDLYSRPGSPVTVVPIFCGHTFATTGVVELGETLKRILADLTRTAYKPEPINYAGTDRLWSIALSVSSGFYKLPAERRFLFVIDALDQVNCHEDELRHLVNMIPACEKKALPANVRIIFSTTDEQRWDHACSHQRFELPDMRMESGSLVSHSLRLNGRRLTSEQWMSVNAALLQADMRPVYLTLLGSYLSVLRSSQPTGEIPVTFEGLLLHYIAELSRPERHGRRMVEMALALILNSGYGIYLSDLDDMLAMDDELNGAFRARSHHDWQSGDEPRLPSIYRSRLYHDLQPLLRMRHSEAGEVVTVYHNAIREVIEAMLDRDVDIASRRILYDYYNRIWSRGHAVALRNLTHAASILVDRNNYVGDFSLMYKHLTDCNYLFEFYSRFGAAVNSSFDEALLAAGGFRGKEAEELRLLRNDLTSMPQAPVSELRERAVNLHPHHFLTREVLRRHGGKGIMRDCLSDSTLDSTVIYRREHCGRFPILIDGGKRLLHRLSDGCRLVDTQFETAIDNDYSLPFDPDDPMAASDNGLILVYWHRGRLQFVDLLGKIGPLNTASTGPRVMGLYNCVRPKWISMTPNGRLIFTENEEAGILMFSVADDWKISVATIAIKGSKKGNVSSDGLSLWVQLSGDKIDLNEPRKKLYDYFRRLSLETWRLNSLDLPMASGNAPTSFHEHAGRLTIYNTDGTAIRYLVKNDERGVYFTFDDIISTYFVDSATYDGSIGFCARRGVVFDLKAQETLVAKDSDGYSAANSLSVDTSGTNIVASFGIRNTSYMVRSLLRVRRKDEFYGADYKMIPMPRDYDLVSCSAVSPDGSRYSMATVGLADYINQYKTIFGTGPLYGSGKIHNWTVGLPICRTVFSRDSRYAAYVCGNWASEVAPWFFVTATEGGLVASFASEVIKDEDGGCFARPTILMSDDNRFVMVSNENPGTRGQLFFDLIDGKVMFLDMPTTDKPQKCHTVYDPVGDRWLVAYGGCLREVRAHAGGLDARILVTSGYLRKPEAVAVDGSELYETEPDGTLYARNLTTGAVRKTADDVETLYVAADGRHLYLLGERRLRLTDLNGDEVEVAWFARPVVKSAVCSRGVVVIDADNDVHFYKPSADTGIGVIGEDMTAVARRRYNLKDKILDEHPTVVCPHCGNVMRHDGGQTALCTGCLEFINVINR